MTCSSRSTSTSAYDRLRRQVQPSDGAVVQVVAVPVGDLAQCRARSTVVKRSGRWPVRIRETSSRSPTSVVSRSADSSIVASERRRRSSSSWPRAWARSKIWAYPLMPVNGRAQLVRGDREELVAGADRLLGLGVEPGVVDGHRAAPPKLLRQRQVGRRRSGGPGPSRASEMTPSVRPRASSGTRISERTPSPRTTAWWLGVARDRRQAIVRELADQLRHAGPQHLGDALAGPPIWRVLRSTSASSARDGSAWATSTRRISPSSSSDVHEAPVREGRHGQPGDAFERRLVVQRRGQVAAGVGQEAQPALGALALGGAAAQAVAQVAEDGRQPRDFGDPAARQLRRGSARRPARRRRG